ncbi:hypothetical protein BD309DRAFT_1016321 [Dichomitus squalens]|uniref:Uncharacterized protein n=1 Tax=Dichomitus squalens TaxID=114155 RepID=A0A4Q9P2W3_9APHY|nr:hypothetical protein BD309DRAFT_1016321 [Dichomitus squalens]TBU57694.1 hypothetical protein BD310DRAFT_977983 [Dichomitus squalens]
MFKVKSPTSLSIHALIILSLPLCAVAQYEDSWEHETGSNTPGAVIAGIVITVFVAIFFIGVCSCAPCRRRRGLAILPLFRSRDATASNQNQSPYSASYLASQQQAWGGQPTSARTHPQEPAPPPPYPGKQDDYEGQEDSDYGYTIPPLRVASQTCGGSVQPLKSILRTPPAAHLPSYSHSPER